jgi:hypothetical protein
MERFFLVLVLSFLLTNCSLDNLFNLNNFSNEFVEIEGERINKLVDVDMFRYLEVDVNSNVELIQSDSLIVNVEGYKNIVDLLDIRVSNSKMTIKFKKSISHKSELNIKIYVPAIQLVLMNGSGQFNIKSWSNEDRLHLKNNGSAAFMVSNINHIKNIFVELNGVGSFMSSGESDKINSMHCILNGSGDINLEQFNLSQVNLELNGSGNIEIGESDLLHATLIGSGNISYKGFPKIHQKIIGSGTIIQK